MMSNKTNDELFDRIGELLPFLTRKQAEELEEYVREHDFDTAMFMVQAIENGISGKARV